MAREGLPFVLGFLALSVICGLFIAFIGGWILTIFLGVFGLLTVFSIYFFRDPKRQSPLQQNLIMSPCDGRIVGIRATSDDFVGRKSVRISIFLNVFNVHVNRVPCSGTVMNSRYNPGKFLPAFDPQSSEKNEQTIIDIQHKNFKLRMKQIAGLIARRIINYLRPGDRVNVGGRFGIIRFGSRMDVIVPAGTEIKVALKQKVRAGETVLGEWNEV